MAVAATTATCRRSAGQRGKQYSRVSTMAGPAALRRGGPAESEQFWRSVGHGATPSMTVMDLTIHQTFLPHDAPDASLAFYRDPLGFGVGNDVGWGGMRCITVGPADQAGHVD